MGEVLMTDIVRPAAVACDVAFLPLRLMGHKAGEVIVEAETTCGAIVGAFVKAGAALVCMASAGAIAYGAAVFAGLGTVSPYLPIVLGVLGSYAMAWRLGDKAADFEVIRSPRRPVHESRGSEAQGLSV
jgi:hypothetical protein